MNINEKEIIIKLKYKQISLKNIILNKMKLIIYLISFIAAINVCLATILAQPSTPVKINYCF
jgi:hypothetical protein